uniref:Cyclin N-terminal domain-containing protein n=1 Tax=Ditylum brightwellii TaxID=49249 RepID=A0A7S2A727_9STRA|mmetsp:Transcript_9941/g.14782  ORF Transcript_9941/g.14782 Transcript_9941/m.14782 type:complete len:761 (+) Transcript_9941:314-2596(+)
MATLVETGSFMTTAVNPKYANSRNGMPSLDRSPPTLLHNAPPESNMPVAGFPADHTAECDKGTLEGASTAQHLSGEQVRGSHASDYENLHYYAGESGRLEDTGSSSGVSDAGVASMMEDVAQDSPGEKKWSYTPPSQAPSSIRDQSSKSQQPNNSNNPQRYYEATMAAMGGHGADTQDSKPNTPQNSAMLLHKVSGPVLLPAGVLTNANMAMNKNNYTTANPFSEGQSGGATNFYMSPDASLVTSCCTTATQTPSNTPPPHALTNPAAYFQPPRPVNPVLYSALGSLEINANGSFNHKIAMANILNQNQAAKNNILQQTSQLSLYYNQRADNSTANKIAPVSTFQINTQQTNFPAKILPQDVPYEEEKSEMCDAKFQNMTIGDEKETESKITEPEARFNPSEKEEYHLIKDYQNNPLPRLHASSNDLAGEGGSQLLKAQKKAEKHRVSSKRVTIDANASAIPQQHQQAQPRIELFRPFGDAYTPRMDKKKKIEYKPPQMRTPVQKMSSTMGTISRPNFRDALRRVAMILQQHIVKIEDRFERMKGHDEKGLFLSSMKDAFSEDRFATPRYKCSMPRVPMARPGLICAQRQIRVKHTIPTSNEIYEFAHQLFKAVQLSSECSIVCLIYVERLMEMGKVPLLACTWRPIFMCGLLLASKVWQDLSSWNIEFALVYPQYSVDAINRLEKLFLSKVKWELYISSSLYAKYYFALRSLLEKQDFRNRYNRMVGGVGSVKASEALQIQKRTQAVKEEVISQLSRSM